MGIEFQQRTLAYQGHLLPQILADPFVKMGCLVMLCLWCPPTIARQNSHDLSSLSLLVHGDTFGLETQKYFTFLEIPLSCPHILIISPLYHIISYYIRIYR